MSTTRRTAATAITAALALAGCAGHSAVRQASPTPRSTASPRTESASAFAAAAGEFQRQIVRAAQSADAGSYSPETNPDGAGIANYRGDLRVFRIDAHRPDDRSDPMTAVYAGAPFDGSRVRNGVGVMAQAIAHPIDAHGAPLGASPFTGYAFTVGLQNLPVTVTKASGISDTDLPPQHIVPLAPDQLVTVFWRDGAVTAGGQALTADGPTTPQSKLVKIQIDDARDRLSVCIDWSDAAVPDPDPYKHGLPAPATLADKAAPTPQPTANALGACGFPFIE